MKTKTIIDALGNKVSIPYPPQRIISTVPSTTEFLFHLGLDKFVVGRTRYCRYPSDRIKKIPNIGGPKDLHMNKIRLLDPDLIFANEEENSREQIIALSKNYPVYVCKIRSLEDALDNIWVTGIITSTKTKAQQTISLIQQGFSKLPAPSQKLRTAYIIWKEPYISVGKDTFINDMMRRCGLKNVFEDHKGRYPRITPQELQEASPQLILLASEPYPFCETNIPQFQQLLPKAHLQIVDGEMFAWYESHLLRAIPYFRELIKQLHG